MKTPLASNVDSLVVSAAIVLALSVLLQSQHGGDVEIWSEILCWLILTLGIEIYTRWLRRQKDKELDHGSPGKYIATIAVGVTLGSLCRSVDDTRWILPLVTPILLGFRHYTSTYVGTEFGPSHPRWYGDSIWMRAAVALGSVLTLIPMVTLDRVVIACIFLLAQVAVYASLNAMTFQERTPLTTGAATGLLRDIAYSSLFMIACGAGARFYWIPSLNVSVAAVLGIGLSKAVCWLLLFHIAQQVPWDIATTTSTFAIASSTSSFPFSSLLRALSRSATAVAALVQTISLIPKTTRGRNLLYVFALGSLLPLLKIDNAFQRGKTMIDNFKGAKTEQTQHPIELLIQKSSEELSAMLERQSSTLDAAVVEYKRRYNRAPPRGFDKWFEHARAQESLIIDDYDSIMESIQPFWSVNPAQLRSTIQVGFSSPSTGNWTFGPSADLEEGSDMWRVLKDVQQDLPNVTVIFNHLDEPRVLLPDTASADTSSNVTFYDLSHYDIWSVLTQPCTRHGEAQGQTTGTTFPSFGLNFVQSAQDAKDLCHHPEFRAMHGMFTAPTTFKYTDAFLPVFSQSKLSTMADVLYPSLYYIAVAGDYKEDDDLPWEEKKPMLYWAGSTTGGFADKDNWHFQHRQRFVTAANQLENATNTYLAEVRPGVWKSYEAQEILAQVYNVKFGNIVQCEEADCEAEKEYFHVGEWQDRALALKHRFIFDLDGNSFSGRFYNLLRSRSVVLKQTVFKEWHDERLFPWVHYVPISLQLDELPETMRYLALTEQGSKRAEAIAENGRSWMSKALRAEDMGIYLYRLVLEYARLLEDDRDEQTI